MHRHTKVGAGALGAAAWLWIVVASGLSACGGEAADCPAGTEKVGPRCLAAEQGTGEGERPWPDDGGAGEAPFGDAGGPGPREDAGLEEPAGCTPSEEICNGGDDDCDGLVDEDVTVTFFADADGDGYGDAEVTADACAPSEGYVDNRADCDDASATVSPDGTEVCNGADDDCDGAVDEHVTTIFFRDADGDGHGDRTTTIEACAAPAGYVEDATDCDDGCATCHPGGTEVCDTRDNDCDRAVDEGEIGPTWHQDCDGDGFARLYAPNRRACTEPPPAAGCAGGWTEQAPLLAWSTDCRDDHASVFPGQTTWFDRAIPGTVDDFDYDCDGLAERESDAILAACPSSCTTTSRGWAAPTGCGWSRTWRTCSPGFYGLCLESITSRTQRCR